MRNGAHGVNGANVPLLVEVETVLGDELVSRNPQMVIDLHLNAQAMIWIMKSAM